MPWEGRISRPAQATAHAQTAFYAGLALVVGPPALLTGWLLGRWLRTFRPYLLLTPAATLALLFLWPWVLGAHSLQGALFAWWGSWLVASALVTLIIRGWQIMFDWLRPNDLDEHLAEQEWLLAEKNARLSRSAHDREREEAVQQPGYLTLGTAVKGDPLPAHLGVKRERGWVLLGEELLNQHLLLIGAPGAGKTETLKRLMAEILQQTERDLFFVDGKGDLALAHQVAHMIYAARNVPVPLFTLGFNVAGAVYHGLRGEPSDLYNRLAALIGVGEGSADAQYYADINRDLLQLICYAPGGPPRSLRDLRRRLNVDWLKKIYRHLPDEAREVEELDPKLLHSLAVRLRPLIREFGNVIDESGFVLEESRGALFCMRTQSVGDSARRLLNFLVEDFKDFIGKRQQRPGVLIIDELGTFRNQAVVDLLMLAQQRNLGVVLATQDIANLGDEDTRRLILADTRTKLLMASDFPEEVAELAGTIQQVEASIQHRDGEATGMGSARIQHAFRIDMNEAARLQAGEGFLIRQRTATKVKVKAVPMLTVDPQAIAPRAAPPSPPSTTAPTPPVPPPRPKAREIPDLDL